MEKSYAEQRLMRQSKQKKEGERQGWQSRSDRGRERERDKAGRVGVIEVDRGRETRQAEQE